MVGLDSFDWSHLAVLTIIGLIGTAFFLIYLRYEPQYPYNAAESKRPSQIIQWAKANGYEIRAIEKKSWEQYPGSLRVDHAGPFLVKTYAGEYAYRVVVTKIGEEKRRVAWIRLKREAQGDSPRDFQVIWEDEWRPSEPPADL